MTAIPISIDPAGYDGVLSPGLHSIIVTSVTPGFFALMGSVVFHWSEKKTFKIFFYVELLILLCNCRVDLYHRAVEALHRNQMIQKINSNYGKPVTYEEIITKVKYFNSMKIPFIFIVTAELLAVISNAKKKKKK